MLPVRENLVVGFAHSAYRFQDKFMSRLPRIACFEVHQLNDLRDRIGEADVLVVSGLWRHELLGKAGKLRLIQSISAGVDQYPLTLLRERGIRLASAQGTNERAVAEHAFALALALYRRLAEARDNQKRRVWRGMMSDLSGREDEIGGKTLLIVGLGRIGGRLAKLAKAFDLRVVGIRRDVASGCNGADEVHTLSQLEDLLPIADIVALTCPLTPETEGILSARALTLMKPSALLVNVSRGACVDEAALVLALGERRIGGAGLDCFQEEPLDTGSALWNFDNVLITPHTAGETHKYEDNVLDILVENLERLWRGESRLRNQVV
jgi:D-2-hydroxyacid dehydrogenase (NADP+)